MNTVASPCIKVCAVDPATGLCRGCFRTLEEIASWSSYSDREKLEVWKRLEARRTLLPAWGCQPPGV
ncbi:MAG: DUF1289 domain-containing protein [Azospira oryzae]|uniref:DUF1289 domain-containing protein n=1 Tax=Pelomicrobium methylotrophicum TaxID=2602750 RepID=A0A5C7EW50_9PROT|nr:DUF1289 domain-containing protein [Pelomicrobium methylotrophicum]PZP57651.1 MAG: DUF1289 domain-containing protein [Azospira oryzae]PZP79254.1 MAG: DUF1289 domain-containing protein [Azospira oryzae]TXF12624.1 DUF1289 domain-containing protein [Pelomicrobium methylotrophicum]